MSPDERMAEVNKVAKALLEIKALSITEVKAAFEAIAYTAWQFGDVLESRDNQLMFVRLAPERTLSGADARKYMHAVLISGRPAGLRRSRGRVDYYSINGWKKVDE